jgi:hypothetical protein
MLKLALLLLGCQQDAQRSHTLQQRSSDTQRPRRSAAVKRPPSLPSPAPRTLEREEPVDRADVVSAAESWILDDLADVGPAGPATATAAAVVLVTRDNEVHRAPLRWPPRRALPRPTATGIEPLALPRERFAPYGRGPAVLGDHAYWISKGKLVRRRLDGGPLEVLATDARDFTRVVASQAGDKAPAVVGYIARSSDGDSLLARIWAEGQGSITLSPEGSSAISVALAWDGTALVSLFIEGRMGMSPVHARRIEVARGKLRVRPDSVLWLAGSADRLTEVHALASRQGPVWALLPIERDSIRFGLARLAVPKDRAEEVAVYWRDYPNGIQPSPVAVAHACGRDIVVYARPYDKTPHGTQELHLTVLDTDGLGPSTTVASSRAFSDVSVAPLDGGFLLTYGADHRTWSRTVRCVRSARPPKKPR